jgi:predicted dinucleotide-binding enzyme
MLTTVAILGAASPTGQSLATCLANGSCSLRLYDQEEARVQLLAQQLKQATPQADVEALSCCATACWEADLAVLVVPLTAQADIARRIRPFVTRKTVWSVTDPVYQTPGDLESATTVLQELQRLLPHSTIRPLPLPYSPAEEVRLPLLVKDAAWWLEQLQREDAPSGLENTF